jgi:hypothetical protein
MRCDFFIHRRPLSQTEIDRRRDCSLHGLSDHRMRARCRVRWHDEYSCSPGCRSYVSCVWLCEAEALLNASYRFYIYVVFYEFFLDGLQFAYIGELFPTHIRAKGGLQRLQWVRWGMHHVLTRKKA